MKRWFLLAFIFNPFTHLFSQEHSLNMSMVANWNPDSIATTTAGRKYNDIWGYTACDRKEYAIIGSASMVHFLDVSTPQVPIEIAAFAGGDTTTWRDIKVYRDRAYAVSDVTDEGMMIFDMSQLPDTVIKTYHADSFFVQAHNLFVDEENHRLYACGAPGADLYIFDLEGNPDNPQLIGGLTLPGGYIHDLYVRDHIAYCSHLENGMFVYDLSNPMDPVTMGSLTNYPGEIFNHSSWLNEDGTHLVFCDEKKKAKVKILDIRELNDLEIDTTNEFGSALLAPEKTNSIAHNPYIIDNYAVVSYYHDGVKIFDISNPDSVIQVAYYDTDTTNTTYAGFFGAWGAYPYLPSGNLLVSDMTKGLYILRADSIPFDPIEVPLTPDNTLERDGPAVTCIGDTLYLKVSPGAETYQWYQDGLPIEENQNFIKVGSDGTYQVEISNRHCNATSEELALSFSEKPDLSNMTAGTITPCEDETVIWEAPSDINTYVWLKDGNALANTTPFIQIVESAAYRLIASNNGCTTISDELMVQFVELPDPDLFVETNYLCEGTSTILEASLGAELYEWFLDEASIGSSQENALATSQPGTYQVVLSIAECSTTSQPVFIEMVESVTPIIEMEGNSLTTESEGTIYQWYFDGMPIEGATESSYVPTENGTYAVLIVDEFGCSNASDQFEVTVTSTFEFGEGKVNFYPNPFETSLWVDLQDFTAQPITISVIDLMGKVLLEQQHQVYGDERLPIQMEHIPAGMYLLQLQLGDKKITRRILKQ